MSMKLSKQDQDNSTSLPAKTLSGKGVEVISDLDIVELSSIDYTYVTCISSYYLSRTKR